MTRTEEFLKLVHDNPDLPIIPLVDADVVCDDCGYWLGDFGRSEVNEYYMGRERLHLKDDDDQEGVLCDLVGGDYCTDPQGRDIYDLVDDEWNALYASVPWVKCIVLYITI